MKTIIIAAGSGKRIGSTFKETPKSMIKVNDTPIINRQVSILKKNDINEIIVITGPYSEKFNLANVTYVTDTEYEKHDILGSLMAAKDHIKDDVLILYSDILFENKIIQQVIKSNAGIGIAVDMNWEEAYIGRTDHPRSEAENVMLDKNNKLLKIRKNIAETKDAQIGEFVGIVKMSNIGAGIFVDKYQELIGKHAGTFQNAPTLLKAYLTDMIQELIDSGIKVEPIKISGKWCEIDTMQDLNRAEKTFE